MLSEKLEFSLANNSGIAELEFTFSFNLKKHFNSIVDMVFQIIVEQWYLMGYNESLDLSKIKELI